MDSRFGHKDGFQANPEIGPQGQLQMFAKFSVSAEGIRQSKLSRKTSKQTLAFLRRAG